MSGGYRYTKKGKPADIEWPVKSMWEANWLRLMTYLRGQEVVLFCEGGEQHLALFPTTAAEKRKNNDIRLDFYVGWTGDLGAAIGMDLPVPAHGKFCSAWFDTKGRLKEGGRLSELDMTPKSQLEKADHDSRVKLGKFQRHYKAQAARTYLVGQREYTAIAKRYKRLVPHWDEWEV